MKPICWLLIIAPSLLAQRLPQNDVPSHYSLSLDPVIAEKILSGAETIDARVSTATKEIALNSLDLDITEAEVKSDGTNQKAVATYDTPEKMVGLSLPQP